MRKKIKSFTHSSSLVILFNAYIPRNFTRRKKSYKNKSNKINICRHIFAIIWKLTLALCQYSMYMLQQQDQIFDTRL